MEAGAADWIGMQPVIAESTEEPSTEERPEETVGEIEGGDKEVENSLPTYSIEEEAPEDEEELIEEDEDEEEFEEEEEEEVVSDNSVSENTVEEESDDGENHDVTKGSWDDDQWTAEATIGENYGIKVTVNAEKAAMVQEKVTEYSPASEKAGKEINDARFSYYKKYEDGDKQAAASDVEDFEDIDSMTNKQMDAFMAVSDDIWKLIAQFGITAYDFKHPAENNDSEIVLDLYCKNKYQFFMTLTFDEDDEGKLLEIEFNQES